MHLQSIYDTAGRVHLVARSAIARLHPQGGITASGSVLVVVELVNGSTIVVDSGCAQTVDDHYLVEAMDRALREVASWFELDVVE